MALRAGLRTCSARLLRPPAGLDLGSPAGPVAPSGSRRPEPARAGLSTRPARNSRRLAEAELGRTATRRLSPCSRLRAFISSAPRPPWSARLRASPDGQARPGTPRCPAQSAQAPALLAWLVPVTRRPRPTRLPPPPVPPSPGQSLALCPRRASPWGPGAWDPGWGQYKKTPKDLTHLVPTCNCAPRGWSNFRFVHQAVMAQRPLGAIRVPNFCTSGQAG